jgi:integrase
LIKYVKGERSRLRFKLDGMAGELEALPLAVIPDADGSFVTYDALSAAVNAIYELANVRRPPKPLHCLRHTFGTVMAKRVPLPVLQKLMGHADVKTTLRYVDVAEAAKRDAIAAVFGSGVAATWQQEPELGGDLR